MEQVLDVMKDYWFLTAGVIIIVILLIIVIIINLKKPAQDKEEQKVLPKEEPNFESLVESAPVVNTEIKETFQNVNIEPEVIANVVEPTVIEEQTVTEQSINNLDNSIDTVSINFETSEPQKFEDMVEQIDVKEEVIQEPFDSNKPNDEIDMVSIVNENQPQPEQSSVEEAFAVKEENPQSIDFWDMDK